MIVKSHVIVDDAVIDVVRFKQMLQRPRPLLRLSFDLVSLYFGQLDATGALLAQPVKSGRDGHLICNMLYSVR